MSKRHWLLIQIWWKLVCTLQSDIIHQSVMELIHSEDRDEFKRQLSWSSGLPQEKSNIPLHEVMLPGTSAVYTVSHSAYCTWHLVGFMLCDVKYMLRHVGSMCTCNQSCHVNNVSVSCHVIFIKVNVNFTEEQQFHSRLVGFGRYFNWKAWSQYVAMARYIAGGKVLKMK